MLPAESIQRLTAANIQQALMDHNPEKIRQKIPSFNQNLVPYKNNVSFNYSKYKLNRFYNEFINNFAVQQ